MLSIVSQLDHLLDQLLLLAHFVEQQLSILPQLVVN